MVALERNPSSIVASFQLSILMRERTCKSWGLAAPRLQLGAAWAAACTWFVCSLRQRTGEPVRLRNDLCRFGYCICKEYDILCDGRKLGLY